MRSHPRRIQLAAAFASALALPACTSDPSAAGSPPIEDERGHEATFACTPSDAASDPFADCLDELVAEGDASFGHDALPDIVLGPPLGGGETRGSMHVASLGCGGSITLAFDGVPILDGPGPDLLVFENPFLATGVDAFVEPGEVLVSADGIDWFGFPCDAKTGRGCAGIEPVLASDAATAVDAELAGGDAFDLDDIGVEEVRWVRIVDRTREHYEEDIWCLGAAGGFDLDAIARVEAR